MGSTLTNCNNSSSRNQLIAKPKNSAFTWVWSIVYIAPLYSIRFLSVRNMCRIQVFSIPKTICVIGETVKPKTRKLRSLPIKGYKRETLTHKTHIYPRNKYKTCVAPARHLRGTKASKWKTFLHHIRRWTLCLDGTNSLIVGLVHGCVCVGREGERERRECRKRESKGEWQEEECLDQFIRLHTRIHQSKSLFVSVMIS